MTEPFKFVVSNDPAKARQAIGTLGVPTDYLTDNSGDYMVNDVVSYQGVLYRCTLDHTAGNPVSFPARWSPWSVSAADPAAARGALVAMHGDVVDSGGAVVVGVKARIVLDEYGDIDDIIMMED